MAVGRRLRFRGKRPTRAAVVNATLLFIESMSPAEQEKALSIGMSRMEEILAADLTPESIADRTPENPPTPPKRVDMDVDDVSASASGKPIRRKKRS